MAAQRLGSRKTPGKFGLAERCVDFLVTNVVQQHYFAALAAFEPRNKVMQALRNVRRDGPTAQRTCGDLFLDHLGAKHGSQRAKGKS